MSQAALAERLGVRQMTVSFWERGKTGPDSRALRDIAGLLQISTDWLLGIEPEEDAA